MHWKFGDFKFDENTKILSNNNQTQLLEPKTSALLSYFCRHPQQDISRDTLLEFVWHGQIVTDGAINRVILKLRKALRDENKIKSYITTVPKVGYRFIANVVPVSSPLVSLVSEPPLIDKVDVVQKQRTISKKWFKVTWSITLLVSILIVYFSYLFLDTNVVIGKPQISPITRLAENQFNASLSHNSKRLAYSVSKNNEVAIFIVDPTKQNPVKVSASQGYASNAHWSLDDKELIYLFRKQGLCQFHRVNFVEGVAQPPEVIYQCSGKSFTNFSYNQAQQKLYFVERETPFAPYSAYELDLEHKSKRRLSQPVALGKGNHLIHRDEKSGRILLLTDQLPGKTTAYELDVNNNSFSVLLAFDYAINSAVWNHQMDGLVHPGEHPSYQLLMSYFNSREAQSLVVDSSRISQVRAVNNGKDYLFTSYMSNRDIEINNKTVPSYNSSVMDYLPQLNRDETQLAFISKRTGFSKVWIVDLTNNNLRSIEPPDRGRTFYSLQWSFDNRYILANTDSGIIVFDSKLLSVITIINPGVPTYGVGWLANEEVAFSFYQNNQWHLNQQNIKTKKIQPYDKRWAFAIGSTEAKLLIDQNMAFYLNESLVSSNLSCAFPIIRRALTVQLVDKTIYCMTEQNSLIKYSEEMGTQTIQSDLNGVRHFSVSGEKITTSKVANSHSDIIRTNF